MITVYMCPVHGCKWSYEESPQPIPKELIPFSQIYEKIEMWTREQALTLEAALQEHLSSHTSLDFLRTIHNLNALLKDAHETLERLEGKS